MVRTSSLRLSESRRAREPAFVSPRVRSRPQVQNATKLVLPIVGGAFIDRAGLLRGFNLVLLASASGYFLCALGAVRAARTHVRRDAGWDDDPLGACDSAVV